MKAEEAVLQDCLILFWRELGGSYKIGINTNLPLWAACDPLQAQKLRGGACQAEKTERERII